MVRTRVGYCGGSKDRPTYRSLGDHTESLQIEYDPAQITFAQLLDVFWAAHDPTERPWSRQYAAILFTADDEQQREALASRDRVAQRLGETVNTEVRRVGTFWRAEDYHQKYVLRSHSALARELRAKVSSEPAFVDSPLAAKLNGWLAGAGDLGLLEREAAGYGLSKEAQDDLLATARRHAGEGGSCPR